MTPVTWRHQRSKDFWHNDAVFHLIVLKHGTDDASRGTHRPVQHVNVLCLGKQDELETSIDNMARMGQRKFI